MRARPKSRTSRTSLLVAIFALISAGTSVGDTLSALSQQPDGHSSFHTYFLDTGWWTYAADISPDGSTAAVYAYKPGGAEQLQIWDFRKSQLIASTTLDVDQSSRDLGFISGLVRFTDDGRRLVVVRRDGRAILVLDSSSLQSQKSIDLRYLQNSGGQSRPSASASSLELDSRGSRAVLLTGQEPNNCQVQVYDLAVGTLIRKWDFPRGVGGVSMDKAGGLVVVPLIPFSPGERPLPRKESNLVILDVDSGREIVKFNTGYLAEDSQFVTNGTVATVSAELELRSHRKDPIRVWDARSGKLLREIRSAPDGVRYDVLVSANSQTILGYVGKQEGGGWFDPASFTTVYDRFRLWDISTGRVIATSPNLPARSAFALSATGSVVLVYPSGAGRLLVYELQ